MRTGTSKWLLIAAALIFGAGSALHAAVFLAKTSDAIGAANLSLMLRAELKTLWLADSTTLMSMAVISAVLAVGSRPASPSLTMLLALVPASTALLLYAYVGSFFAAHLLVIGALLMIAAGWLRRPIS
jgi:hypothetical protein